MLTACTCANRSASSRRTGVLRSDENAIQFPSGDQDGRKLPGACVRFCAFLVCKSSTQMSADPVPREDTKASCFPSGESAAWSSYAGCRVGVDVATKFTRQIGDRCEDAARNDLAFDFGEPEFDLVEPRRIGRREVKLHARMPLEEIGN